MERGWNAEGLLQPLWQSFPGKRDGLAAAAGTSPGNLSSINQGKRPLGRDLGSRLADALGVSLLELGAPEAVADDQGSLTLRDRLEGLAADLAESVRKQAAMAAQIRALQGRLRSLEARPWPDEDHPTGTDGR